MTKKLNVWGRDFDLKIFFDVYKGEAILDTQNDALDAFIAASKRLLAECNELKEFCLKQDGDKVGNSVENIFKYVIPESLFIARDENKHRVALLCNYRFDEEHGIALFFENEKLAYIGSQDDI